MSPRRANKRDSEVQQKTTTRATAISHHLTSSNLLESTQMHDEEEKTTSESGCSQFRSVNHLLRKHHHQSRQPIGSSGEQRRHAPLLQQLSELTIDVMPTRVSSTKRNLDTQVNSRSLIDMRGGKRSVSHPLNQYCSFNASSMVVPLWALSSCCLMLMLAANLGQCAPTTKIVSQQPVATLVNLHNNNGPSLHSSVVKHDHPPATNQQQISMTNEQATSGLVEVQPIIIVNSAHHEPSKKRESSSGHVTSAHHTVNKFATVAAIDDDESSIEDETILLVLAGESSPSSIRRLMKRSGISDQRLAEIQMIRALKKQMERAATKIAAEAGGNGASGNAGGEVK